MYIFSSTLTTEDKKTKQWVWSSDNYRYTFKHTPAKEKELKLMYNIHLNS